MKGVVTWFGQSLVLNSLFILLNITGVTFVTMAFHKNNESNLLLFGSIGLVLLLISIVGLVIFKGRLFMSYFSRIIVGGLFIVSGLIKANDPLGFSYKLEEYFEDGALAFRIKEWFGMPGFSLEFLMCYALFFSVLICILEIVLGVLTIIGGKIRFVAWSLMVIMLFFTFLTWHTANCNPDKQFLDRDTYSINNPVGVQKLEELKSNKSLKLVAKTSDEIIIDEMKQPQCVNDCGCFGDAMKGSLGRSLTPSESLWKDYLLVYFSFWIFIAQRIIQPNSFKENSSLVLLSMLVIVFFSFVFGWFFPVLFGLFVIMLSLWLIRAGGMYFSNYWSISAVITVVCLIFVWYVLSYEPLKDYRPYAEGSNLKQKMNDGIEGKYQNLLVYSNLKTGEKKEFDASSKLYLDSKIWEKTKLWKYDTMINKEIIPTKLPSISNQFNPMINFSEIGVAEKKLKFIQDKLSHQKISGVIVRDKGGEQTYEITPQDYADNYSDTSLYEFIRRSQILDPALSEISLREYILKAPRIFVVFSKELSEFKSVHLERLKAIKMMCSMRKIPFVLVCNANREEINVWRNKNNFQIAAFSNDATELKAIARSNPSLMIVEKGIVKEKFPWRSFPSVNWLKKYVFK
jgi:uncharacterized membrane protein YphA (DoxX/SURF4 family)